MKLTVFSLRSIFPPSADAKGLSDFWRLRNSLFLLQQKQLKHPRRPDIVPACGWDIGIPKNQKACFG
ncbi:MAG: hypothetical protein AABZ65_04540 [Candidatus Omnitrophota bacterium]